MRKYYRSLLLCYLFSMWSYGQIGEQQSPVKTTLCELYEHPEQYSGKIVSVRASVAGSDLWIDSFDRKACPSWMQVIAVFPDKVKPTPGFSLARDESLTNLLQGVRLGKGVQATFEGRFDPAFVWRNHKKFQVGTEQGYGKKQKYGGRLVLQRVSDVSVLPGSRL